MTKNQGFITEDDGLPFRVGIGYDMHALGTGRALVLGGVTIPYERGLVGHSDADVLTHVIIDAVIGALNGGSIGLMFPDTDPQWQGVRSVSLLAQVVAHLQATPYRIGNVDATVVAQAPKLMPYRTAMQTTLAGALQVAPHRVSIKATTTERLGPEGHGEGISAHAVVLLIRQ